MFILLPLFIVSFLMSYVNGGNLLYKIARFWADAFFFFIGIKPVVIAEENRDIRKQYIFVSNHISYLDIPMMLEVIRHQHVRILGKAEMTKVPVFGYIYKRGAVLVYRDDPEKRSESVQNLIDFIHKNISVFICPEGTFNLTHHPLKQFYDGAFRIAIETQTPILPVLFPDTYDRLNYKSIFSLNPGKCRAVYLPETSTAGLSAENLPALKEKIYRQMEEGLIRYKASWIR
jgi:1-acyl-sn-glycerol-3-phosphate acyltransferase